MTVFCIDIGNTHTHFALIGEKDARVTPGKIATRDLEQGDNALYREIEALSRDLPGGYGISYSSVAPSAGNRLYERIACLPDKPPLLQLTHETVPREVRLHYPRPEEIGQDRLANAVAAVFRHSLPCVIIDLGTAVTFDIVSSKNGYEGGIIAPGIGVMTGYLHHQTALLPKLSETFEVTGAIGKSTRQAMSIGCVIGFRGMLEALLRAVIAELSSQGEPEPLLILTGGCADFLFPETPEKSADKANQLAGIEVLTVSDLTLQGLAVSFRVRNSA